MGNSSARISLPHHRSTDGRPWWLVLLQLGGTTAAFKLAADFAAYFAETSGASFLFPPAAVSLAAGGAFGAIGVLGVVAGSFLSPWGAAATWQGLVLFAAVHALTAAIPAWALRKPRGASGRRVARVIAYGVVINNLASALTGSASLILLGQLPLRLDAVAENLVAWSTSDLMAALVLGLPLLTVLRPSAVMAEPDRSLFRDWLRDAPSLSSAFLLLAASLLVIWGLGAGGWDFPHWLTVLLIGPVAWAAFVGGVGAALLVELCGSILYFLVFLRLQPDLFSRSIVEVVAPVYLVLAFFSCFAIIGGLLAGGNRILLNKVRQQEALLRKDFDRVVAALSAAIEAKDPTTEGHVQRVADLAVEVGRRMEIADRDLDLLRYAALLHDVGKIGVPESVLNKPGPLSFEERNLVEQHVEIGVRIISPVELLREVAPLVRYHQERWDGAREGVAHPGYHGLRGEETPLAARILCVADAVDAMLNDRPYRSARSLHEVLDELGRESGRQFDPDVARVVSELLLEEAIPDGQAPTPPPRDRLDPPSPDSRPG